MSNTITLGRSGLQVTPICFGCWQMGGTFWGPQPRETLIAAVHAALEVGVTFFDTADAYGDGEAERILGEALKDTPRDRVVIATKAYHHFHDDGRRFPDLSKDYLLAECDASLKRLGLDHIDLYQAHAWETLTPIAETVEAMELLVQQGKIRAYGVSNFSAEQLRAALRHGSVSTIQPYYNLLDPKGEDDLLPLCQVENIGVLIYSPLLRGLLTGKYTGEETFDDLRANDERFRGETFKKLIAKVEQLRSLAQEHGCNIAQLVLAATLRHAAIHCAIVGIKTPEQIKDAAVAMDVEVDRETYHKIRELLR